MLHIKTITILRHFSAAILLTGLFLQTVSAAGQNPFLTIARPQSSNHNSRGPAQLKYHEFLSILPDPTQVVIDPKTVKRGTASKLIFDVSECTNWENHDLKIQKESEDKLKTAGITIVNSSKFTKTDSSTCKAILNIDVKSSAELKKYEIKFYPGKRTDLTLQTSIEVVVGDEALPSNEPVPAASPAENPETAVSQENKVEVEVNPKKIIKGSPNQPIEFTVSECKDWKGKKFILETESGKKLQDNDIKISETPVFETVPSGKCRVTAHIAVGSKTRAGIYKIKFQPDENAAAALEANIEVVGEVEATKEPIPPGLDPQVDVMWAVVPNKIVKDNFGPRIGKLFYCIEVVIGNNTGYSLQIATVGFKLGPTGKAATLMAKTYESVADTNQLNIAQNFQNIIKQCTTNNKFDLDCVSKKTEELKQQQAQLITRIANQAQQLTKLSQIAYAGTVPVSSYQIARGSASHGQFWNTRNLALSIIKALGPVLTGVTPFFSLPKQRNFSEAVNVFNNPFEKGLEAVLPDETVPQLQRLDDQVLRDGMIIPNNRQVRTRAFIPKSLLMLDKEYKDNPIIITQSLGTLYLIGDEIEYLNRVNVTSGGSGEITPPPTVNPTYKTDYKLGDKDIIADFTGTNLKGATIQADDPDNILVTITENTNTTVSTKITVKETAETRNHTLTLTTARGSIPITINVKQPLPGIKAGANNLTALGKDEASPVEAISLFNKETEYTIKLEGNNLKNAFLEPQDIKNEDGTIIKNPLTAKNAETPNTNNILLKAKITVPPGTLPNAYPFKVKNTNTGADTEDQIVTFTIKSRTLKISAGPVFAGTGQPNKPAASQQEDLSYNFRITGSSLEFAVITAPKGIVVTIIPATDGNGNYTGVVKIPANTPPGSYPILLNDIGDQQATFTVVVVQPDIVVEGQSPISLSIAPGLSADLNLSGENFTTVISDSAHLSIDNTDWKVSIYDSFTQFDKLKLKFTAPAADKFTGPTDLKVTLKNSNGNTYELKILASPAPSS